MPFALMSLGQNVFYIPQPGVETPGYETLQRDSSFTWVPQGRIGAPLAMQYTGQGQDIIVIEGRLFPKFFGGARTLDALRFAGAQGKPLPLIRYHPARDDNGNLVQGMQADVLGDFVIVRVRVAEKNIASDGDANHIEFQLELSAYGNDGDLTSSTIQYTATQGTDASNAQASNTPVQPTGPTTTPGG